VPRPSAERAATTPHLVDEKPARQSVAAQAIGAEVRAGRRRSGPAAAVVLAAGIACFALGLLTVVTAASSSVSNALTLSNRVGDVSGLSAVTFLTFFAAWGGLAVVWRRADPSLTRIAAISAALVVLGLIGTFPPVFHVFGG
jgi:hypothetical protein